ncbi:voltage-dependent chloride channel 2, chloroplastic isoform X2 [Physcomitrium patens]|uniref:Uncharacterized protein n=1 Tax=Physcomitrium patens TaxID=3218 RepID=A0A7I4DYF7_PHYPA|nr:UPF0187 protein At2g45870, chloroplastic-like isoform X2 [Physcomitrium patens]|eukprot:XP_024378617.1 UPF0187 protein At2g45870, chloroplastic-like isoform X2 [Physcomitrella patens]
MHRNTVYGHDEWRRHKSSWRHARHVISIAASGVIAALGPPVLLSTITAVFVTVINHGVQHMLVASWVPYLKVSPIPFTFISPVLAFLLVFRTNSSYQRFDEARKVWGSNVNRCRDLARQALSWIKNPEDAARLECLLRFLKAYPYYLKLHLTQEGPSSSTTSEIKDILKDEEFHKVSLVGVVIEEPFCILALDSICGGIRSAIDMFRATREDVFLLTESIRSEHPKKTDTTKNLEQIIEMESMDSDPLEETSKEDEVMLGLGRSKSYKSYSGRKFFDKSRSHSHSTTSLYGDLNVGFSKLKSVS